MKHPHDTRTSRSRLPSGSIPRRRLAWVVCLFLGGGAAALAQLTNAPSRVDYDTFRSIADRNIFNATRRGYSTRASASRSGPLAETMTLVGTLRSPKGAFAFFDGTTAGCRTALQVSGTLAAGTVVAIAPDEVTLNCGGTQVVLRVGSSLRREAGGGWRPAPADVSPAVASDATPAAATGGVAAAEAAAAPIEPNDILKKLMQQRERELK